MPPRGRVDPEILLVEDNPGDVLLVRKALERAGLRHELRVAGDGDEALALLRAPAAAGRARPGLVLLDLNLPGKDGREVLAEIKGDPALRVLPVVVLTSSRAERDVRRAYELHANSYVTKPPSLRELQGTLARLCDYWFAIVEPPPGRADS